MVVRPPLLGLKMRPSCRKGGQRGGLEDDGGAEGEDLEAGDDGSSGGGAAAQAEIEEPSMGPQPRAEGEQKKKPKIRGRNARSGFIRQREAEKRRNDEAAESGGGPVGDQGECG